MLLALPALQKRHHPAHPDGSNGSGIDITIAVVSVDATAKKITKLGGKITMPRMTINTIGHLIRFRDTEGNTLGAMEYDENAS